MAWIIVLPKTRHQWAWSLEENDVPTPAPGLWDQGVPVWEFREMLQNQDFHGQGSFPSLYVRRSLAVEIWVLRPRPCQKRHLSTAENMFRTKFIWEEKITVTSCLVKFHQLLTAFGAGVWGQLAWDLAMTVNHRCFLLVWNLSSWMKLSICLKASVQGCLN